MAEWQDYFETGTDLTVLKNKFAFKNLVSLENAERRLTRIKTNPTVSFDFTGLKQIHQHLFADIYPWAGEPRQVNMMKGNHTFTNYRHIEALADNLFAKLQADNYLQGVDVNNFINKAAKFFAELNQLHPFREGNGRTQRLMIQAIAKQAGYPISFRQITQERMIYACIDFSRGNHDEMQQLFTDSIISESIDLLREFNDFFKQVKGLAVWNNQYIATASANTNYRGIFVGKANKGFAMQLDNEHIIIGDNRYLTEIVNSGEALVFSFDE